MRTTLDIHATLLRQAKKRAADEGISLSHIVEAALRMYLGGRRRKTDYRLRWGTERGQLLAGINLDDRDALFDLMNGRR